MIDDPEVMTRIRLKGLRTDNIMIRIIFQRDINHISRSAAFFKQITIMIPVTSHNQLGRKITIRNFVHPKHSLISFNPRINEQILSRETLRYRIASAEPAVSALSFPDISRPAGD